MKWLLCDQLTAKISLFVPHSQMAYQTEVFWITVYFRDWQMTAVWTNNSLTFTFHYIFSNSHTQLNNFCKSSFRVWCWVYEMIIFYCILAYMFHGICILSYLLTCILAYSRFCAASKSDLKWLRFSFNGKMSKEVGCHWTILALLDNIIEWLNLLRCIWQYWALSKYSLQCHYSEVK